MLPRWRAATRGERRERNEAIVRSVTAHVREQRSVHEQVSVIPGEDLQRQGVDQAPTRVLDDEVTAACVRLLELHDYRK